MGDLVILSPKYRFAIPESRLQLPAATVWRREVHGIAIKSIGHAFVEHLYEVDYPRRRDGTFLLVSGDVIGYATRVRRQAWRDLISGEIVHIDIVGHHTDRVWAWIRDGVVCNVVVASAQYGEDLAFANGFWALDQGAAFDQSRRGRLQIGDKV